MLPTRSESNAPQAAKAVVAVEYSGRDVREAVRRALDAADWTRAVPAGADVSLKVNLGWDLFIPGSITSPLVVECLIEAIRPHVGKIYVVEADQVLEDVERAFRLSGMAEVCRRTGATWLNLSRERTVPVHNSDNVVLKRIDLPWVLRETLLVTVPVMKTHAKTGLTGALKNQWGCLNKLRHEYHLVLDDALADLNSVLRPALALMDATIGLEGNGPKSGHPRVADRILCSADSVALDTVQATIMGLDPACVRHLATCAARGIGTNDLAAIDVRSSEPLPPLAPFLPARHNAVSHVENFLRRSPVKPLVFNTPLFRLLLLGAKMYYHSWAWRHAGEAWDAASAHPVYGPQWRTLARPWPIQAAR
jgi:uncharacterized protein (DUF362 family)